jgi:phospholipid/cholesterol/gamma-HCH transport system substrate-binding protein
LKTRLGLFVALVVFAAFLIINTVGGLDKFRRGLHVYALFNAAHELKKGDSVKMAGVEIGRVEEITLSHQQGQSHDEAPHRRGKAGHRENR